MLAPLALILAQPAGVAGLYETQQMEVAAALELKPDGRFRYVLTYGAVDEAAQGRWTRTRDTVRLTSDPRPKVTGGDEFMPAEFRNEPLARSGTDLLLLRYDTRFRFVKVRP